VKVNKRGNRKCGGQWSIELETWFCSDRSKWHVCTVESSPSS